MRPEIRAARPKPDQAFATVPGDRSPRSKRGRSTAPELDKNHACELNSGRRSFGFIVVLACFFIPTCGARIGRSINERHGFGKPFLVDFFQPTPVAPFSDTPFYTVCWQCPNFL